MTRGQTVEWLRANACPELLGFNQWIGYTLEKRDGKQTKVPRDPHTGGLARVNDPATWAAFDDAIAAIDRFGFDGVGFVLTPGDPFICIDLDKCIDASGALSLMAGECVRLLGSYTEYSVSGAGLHVWTRGTLPQGRRRARGIEVYDSARFLVMTFRPYGPRRPIADASPEALDWLMHRLEVSPDPDALAAKRAARAATTPLPETESAAGGGWQDDGSLNGGGEHHRNGVDLDDDALIEKALNASNGQLFHALFVRGDLSAYGGDASAADMALCNLLAFWTNRNAARMDRIFRRGALMREKWNVVHSADGLTYGQMTVAAAISGTPTGYDPLHNGNGARPSVAIANDYTVPTFHLTDLGNAQRFAKLHRDKARFCHGGRGWLIWDGRRWAPDRDDEVMRLARDVPAAIYAEAARASDPDERKAIARWAILTEGERRIRAMLALAESEAALSITGDMLDRGDWLLNVYNGTLDLITGELRAHDPNDLITRLAPVDYDPSARLDLLDRFMHDATGGNTEFAAFVQRAGGYSLTGDTAEEVLFLLLGPTNSGKTTLQEMVAATLGDYARAAAFKSFLQADFRNGSSADPDVARLDGARFLRSSESDRGKRLDEDLLKALTGGDTIVARFLHKNPFEFKPRFKLWLASNFEPKVSADDEAIWRRVIRLPFIHSVPAGKRDPAVKKTLTDPAQAGAAVLAWLVQGCLNWQHTGLAVPDLVRQATTEYRESQDTLGTFLAERCILSPDAFAPASALRMEYERWAKENGELPIGGRVWGDALRSHGLTSQSHRSAGAVVWGWKGIGLRADEATGAPGGAKPDF